MFKVGNKRLAHLRRPKASYGCVVFRKAVNCVCNKLGVF